METVWGYIGKDKSHKLEHLEAWGYTEIQGVGKPQFRLSSNSVK